MVLNKTNQRIWVCGILLTLLLPWLSLADDVGLVTAKLTEAENHRYVIEADIAPAMLNMILSPQLPDDFTLLKPEQEQQGALINVRYPFQGTRSLGSGDTILLPWGRSGVLIHAKWVDGSSSSKLFLNGLGGIPVEIGQIKPMHASRLDSIQDALKHGFKLVSKDWKLWLPLLGIVFLFPRPRAARILWMVAAGLALSLLVLDFHPGGISWPIAVCIMLVALILAAQTPESPQLAPIFISAALVLGLSGASGLAPEPRWAFMLGLLVFYGGVGSLLVLLRSSLSKKFAPRILSVVIGGVAVAALLVTILRQEKPDIVPKALNLPQQAGKSSTQQIPRKLTDPISVFLSIEPYETRCEIMASGRAIEQLLGGPLADPAWIDINEQEEFKQQALDMLERFLVITIDGETIEPSLRRADFLTLGTAGAFSRTDAVREAVNEAIVGLTFSYIRPAPPETITLQWKHLPGSVTKIPATVIEPAGNQGYIFTSDNLSLNWENTSSDLQPMELLEVQVMPPTWALFTLTFLVGAWAIGKKPKWSYACIALSILLFPVGRIPVPFGSPLQTQEAKPVVEQLLSNIYRAFDFRDESAIYDQLAISVEGDQLTEIYLNQRRALELENRGGARARVETVEVTDIESVERTDNGISVLAKWKISGSVNHFGHTHYRQNAYHATLELVPTANIWKVSDIEVHDEERIY